jgi:hypothetical protein
VKSRRSDSQWCRLDDDSAPTERGTRRKNANVRAWDSKRRWEVNRCRGRVQNSDICRRRCDRRGPLVAEGSGAIRQGRSVIRRLLFMAALRARRWGPMMLVLHARHITDRAQDGRAQQCHKQNGRDALHTHQSTTLRRRSASRSSETYHAAFGPARPRGDRLPSCVMKGLISSIRSPGLVSRCGRGRL